MVVAPPPQPSPVRRSAERVAMRSSSAADGPVGPASASWLSIVRWPWTNVSMTSSAVVSRRFSAAMVSSRMPARVSLFMSASMLARLPPRAPVSPASARRLRANSR